MVAPQEAVAVGGARQGEAQERRAREVEAAPPVVGRERAPARLDLGGREIAPVLLPPGDVDLLLDDLESAPRLAEAEAGAEHGMPRHEPRPGALEGGDV